MTSRIPAISEILAVIIILAVSGVVGSILYLNYSENAADSIDIISDRNSLAMKKATELVDISFPTSFPGKVEFLIHNYSPKDVLNKDEFAVYIMDDMGNVRNGDLEKLEFYKKSGDDRRDMVRVESGNFAQASYTGIDCPEESLILVTPAKEIIEIPTDEPCACPTGERPASDGTICVPLEWDADDILCEEVRGDRIVDKCLGFGHSTCDQDRLDGDGVGECICLSTDSSVLNQDTCECVIDGATWNDDLYTCECRSDKVVKNGACACPDGEVVCGGACRAESQCAGFRCENDGTCKDGDICNGGECVTPECDDTNPCQTAGEICVDRQCEPDPNVCDPICTGGQECVSGTCECPTGKTLQSGVCRSVNTPPPEQCTPACETGERCNERGQCVPDCQRNACEVLNEFGDACESTCGTFEKCDGSGACVCDAMACAETNADGACDYTCTGEKSSCFEGVCGKSDTTLAAYKCAERALKKFNCLEPSNNPRWCTDICQQSAENEVCVNGACVCPPGKTRANNNICEDITSCDADACQVLNDRNRCVSECVGDERCDGSGNCVEITCDDNLCQELNNAGDACVSDCSAGETCDGSGNCITGTRAPVITACTQGCHNWDGSRCVYECRSGFTCSNDQCVRSGCTGGRVMVNGQCEVRVSCGSCYSYDRANNECDYRCAGNQSCTSGRCVTTSCYGTDVLIGGRCVERANCPSSECKSWQAGNTCRDWCTDGTCDNGSCTRDTQGSDKVTCDSNQCLELSGNSCVSNCTKEYHACDGSGGCERTGCPSGQYFNGSSCESFKNCAATCQTLDRSSNTCTGGCVARQACESGTCVQKSCPGTLLLINGSCVTRTTCSSSSCLTLDTSSNSCKSTCTGYKKACSGGSCVCGSGLIDSGSSCDSKAKCSGRQLYDSRNNRCYLNCGLGSIYPGGDRNTNAGFCENCPSDERANSDATQCVAVTGCGTYDFIGGHRCVPCGDYYKPTPNKRSCEPVDCPAPNEAPKNHRCVVCADNQKIALGCPTLNCPSGQVAKNHQCVPDNAL